MSPPTAGAVLLIYGNHRLLVEDELKKVQSRIADAGEADFNLDVFEAGTGPIEDALQAAETLPFGSDRRYVIVKEAQNLGAAEVKKLARYLENPSDTSALILAAVDLKSNSSLVKVVEKGGRVREVNKRRDQVPGWIRGRFKERGLKVSGKAIAYLQEALGEDLMAIERAVEKVSLYHEGEEAVELDEVVSLVSPSAERSIFELVDRVALGDADQALKLLGRLQQQGERSTYILNALARRFRQLLLYRALREEGRREADIVDYLKLPGNQAWMVGKKLRPQASRLDEDTLRKALSLLVEVDMAIKTGEMEEEFAAQIAVSGLSSLVAGKTPPRLRIGRSA
ncbi:MAG: DNA polymerase III subunit delta [Actinomycetota bacterium]|nr:DNA polymerase III subunit delta [Actinomycetota bacterium]